MPPPPGSTVVDLLSSDEDDVSDCEQTANVTATGKRPAYDEDGECCIIERPLPPALRKPAAPEPSCSTADCDVLITGHTGANALSDFPHARNNCVAFKWADAPAKHCPQCFCYVCDAPVAKCSEWSEHCNATHDQPHWQALRRRRAAEKLRNPAPAPVAASSSSASSSSASSSSASSSSAPVPAPSGWTCERLVNSLVQVYPVEATTPQGLVSTVTLKPYQKQSLQFMLEIEKTTDPKFVGSLQLRPGSTATERRGGWLCDEVGMGKVRAFRSKRS